MKTVAIIQARMGSSRLPGKVLMDLAGLPVLEWVLRAARAIPGVAEVVVATSEYPGDDAVAEYCARNGTRCHRGPENDVLARFAQAAGAAEADLLIRLTGDCPLLDPDVCGAVLKLLQVTGADYATNADPAMWPDGLDCEVFTRAALSAAEAEASSAADREHMTSFIRDRRSRFKVETLICPIPGLHSHRWTLDSAEDHAFLDELAGHLETERPPSYLEVLEVLRERPALESRAHAGMRNESYIAQLGNEPAAGTRQYAASDALLERAMKVVPLGSQTFSKSFIQYPRGAAPMFLSHGRGGQVWDVDGNNYVDMVCGLLPVVLGYCDPDVDAAIRAQMCQGISFSLATELEAQLAETMCELVPCAEQVRFGKNGTDATSAAVRLARAHTGREHVVACGYHGWQDWYIGATTRSRGVPAGVRALTRRVAFNDPQALEDVFKEIPDGVAAVILEPTGAVEPASGYLESVRDLCDRHGVVLIFDEIITGFRIALGGAQAHYGVTPDLACFGKSMGNGMPISACVGRADLMVEMERVFLSGTFGGEALSLAAAIAVIEKMQRLSVIGSLWQTGSRLRDGTRERLARFGLEDSVSLNGLPPWTVFAFRDHAHADANVLKTLFLKECLARGVLTNGSHNVSFAHGPAEVARVLRAYDEVFAVMGHELQSAGVEERLGCPVVRPVFSVR